MNDLAEASQAIDDLAELVGAPAPGLLAHAKAASGVKSGLDEHGDLAVVLLGVEPGPQFVILAPVTDFDEFVSGFNPEAPDSDVVEVKIGGSPTVVGRIGSFAAMAPTSSRAVLEKFFTSTESLASNESLGEWIEESQACVALTENGIKLVLPKLIEGVRAMQNMMRQMGGEQGEFTASAMNMYVTLFEAAEHEVSQVGLAVEIDEDRTTTLMKFAEFQPDGQWSEWSQDVDEGKDQLAGLPAGPFVAAFGSVLPADGMKHLMDFSTQMMKSMPHFKLTDKQAEEYSRISAASMDGVESIRFLLGVPDEGEGLYGNAVVLMTVADSEQYLETYKKSMEAFRKLAAESQSPMIPKMESKPIEVDGVDGLEISMQTADLAKAVPGGEGAEVEKMMELMMGPGGALKIYMAPLTTRPSPLPTPRWSDCSPRSNRASQTMTA